MSREDRKARVEAWKEGRKSRAGIFRVDCPPAGKVWLGVSRNLDSQQNGVWFSLRHGGSPNREMQAAWNAQVSVFTLSSCQYLGRSSSTWIASGRAPLETTLNFTRPEGRG